MRARMGRLTLPTALERALEFSRQHDYRTVEVVDDGDGMFRVIWPGTLDKDQATMVVAEVKAVRRG